MIVFCEANERLMSHRNETEDKALNTVEELFKTIIATSGIMLALLWGLTQREDLTQSALSAVQNASIVFVVSIFFSFLGNQFIVTKLHKDASDTSKKGAVPFCFLLAWVTFIVGCVLLIVSLFSLSSALQEEESMNSVALQEKNSKKLGDFENVDFGKFRELNVDTEFLQTIATRLIADTEIAVYILAKQREAECVDGPLMISALQLLYQENPSALADVPQEAIVSPGLVWETVTAPVKHEHEAITILSKFANSRLIQILRDGAKQADDQGDETIEQRHLLPFCDKLPFPLNVYLC